MSSLLSKTRRLNRILQKKGTDPVSFDDICALLSEVLSCNVYILEKHGKVLGHTFCKDFEWFGNIDFESQFNDKFSELIKIFAQENMPVVLSFETNTKFIAAETGSDSKEYIDWFRNYLDSNEMRQRMSESLRIIDTHVISPENIWICVYSDGYWSETVKLIDFAIDN